MLNPIFHENKVDNMPGDFLVLQDHGIHIVG